MAERLQTLLAHVSNARYADLRLLRRRQLEVALREDSLETGSSADEQLACRVLKRGDGVASTNRVDRQTEESIVEAAARQADAVEGTFQLAAVKPEQGRVQHSARKPFDVEEATKLLQNLRQLLRAKLGALYVRSELIASHSVVESTFVTSEGAEVTEMSPLTDIVIYVVVRDFGTGVASKVVGGKGGFEVLEAKDWNGLLDDLVRKAQDAAHGKLLSPLLRGTRLKIIFDGEATGALAHEMAHMLEADIFQSQLFAGLKSSEDFQLIDDPTITGAYGSFVWDDEGVCGERKELVKRGQLSPLHTRLTARGDDMPGNAHGITHRPRPSMSNVYIQPSDWRPNEIFEETASGIFVRGVVKAETDTSTGRFELIPEVAYLIEDHEIKTPLKQLRVTDSIRSAMERIDAIARVAMLRPNVEKGFCISEGGPFIRAAGLRCS